MEVADVVVLQAIVNSMSHGQQLQHDAIKSIPQIQEEASSEKGNKYLAAPGDLPFTR